MELALPATVLAELVGEVGNEALLALLDVKDVGRGGAYVVLAGSDDTVGDRNVVAVEVSSELQTRQPDGLAKERNTCGYSSVNDQVALGQDQQTHPRQARQWA